MIGLFTDFGANGPYLGQMEVVLRQSAPGIDIVHLVNNAPLRDPRSSAYLLAAIHADFPDNSVILCVVDPGVGGDRLPIVLSADGKWFVGPDNGLLNTTAVQATDTRWYTIEWKPQQLSSSFHGRDLFAPIAASIAIGEISEEIQPYAGPDLTGWPADLSAVIYIDTYGNAVTGWRYTANMDHKTLCLANGTRIQQAKTFCAVEEGLAFWYCNSSGLVEIAVNQGRADRELGLMLSDEFWFE